VGKRGGDEQVITAILSPGRRSRGRDVTDHGREVTAHRNTRGGVGQRSATNKRKAAPFVQRRVDEILHRLVTPPKGADERNWSFI